MVYHEKISSLKQIGEVGTPRRGGVSRTPYGDCTAVSLAQPEHEAGKDAVMNHHRARRTLKRTGGMTSRPRPNADLQRRQKRGHAGQR